MKKLVILGLLLLLAPRGFSTEMKTVIVGSPVWDGLVNEDGSGAYLEAIRTAFELSGVKLKHKNMPFARATNKVQNKKIDGIVAEYVISDKDYLYPKWHIDIDVIVAVFKKSRFPNWQGKTTMKNKNVGWIRGYGFESDLKVKTNWSEKDALESLARMLNIDRLDFVLDYVAFMNSLKQVKDVNLDDYRMESVFSKHAYVAFSNTERSAKLIQLLDQGMEQLKQSGKLKAIYQKWGYDDYPMPLRKID